MLSASNMPIPSPDERNDHAGVGAGGDKRDRYDAPTTVLILPSFTQISNVTPETVPALITSHVNRLSSNTSPLPTSTTTPTAHQKETPSPTPLIQSPAHLTPTSSPHAALVLLCSQRTRDIRCGQSAPLLRRELERHLRPLGLQRDLGDERPGGVGIYFISHVGGHKYAANVLVYRRRGAFGGVGDGAVGDVEDVEGAEGLGEAGQCIWLARVRPEDCENVVNYTVLRGRVVKPERQLRGGFDRERGVCSW